MKKGIVLVLLIVMGALVLNYIEAEPQYRLERSTDSDVQVEAFLTDVVGIANTSGIRVILDDEVIAEDMLDCYITSQSGVMMPLTMLRDYFGCDIDYLENGDIQVEIGSVKLCMTLGSNAATVNDSPLVMKENVTEQGGIVYVPVLDIAGYIYLSAEYSLLDNTLTMQSLPYEEVIPEAYDMRAAGRVTPVRNQGSHGNCWAYASLGAVETTLMPEEAYQFSANYMSKNSGYNVDDTSGGDYTMAVAYLARWDGPVARLQDSADRSVLKHLEEAVFIGSKDYRTIKEYIYKYGGVQSSIYINLELQNENGGSKFYNEETAAYYFDEQETTNHDIVIVGWDDHYPKENFSIMPAGDGAFICKNSWGEKFGDEGYFYISYYDTNIGTVNTCYSKLGDVDNFDYIYQTDQLGWVGELGFDCSNAYFANVYETHEAEELAAVAFYATGVNTTYKVYVVPEYLGEASMKNRQLVAEGSFADSGYYTVRLEDTVDLPAGSKYAVIVYIDTPDSVHPVAIEYAATEKTETFDITDGEGYVSLYGESWTNVEAGQNANVCLKAFTNKKP